MFDSEVRSHVFWIPNRIRDMKKQFLSQVCYHGLRKEIYLIFSYKNDSEVHQSIASLFPSHVKEEGYFCRHSFEHIWILFWRLHSGRTLYSTRSPICLTLPYLISLFFAVEIFPLIGGGSVPGRLLCWRKSVRAYYGM